MQAEEAIEIERPARIARGRDGERGTRHVEIRVGVRHARRQPVHAAAQEDGDEHVAVRAAAPGKGDPGQELRGRESRRERQGAIEKPASGQRCVLGTGHVLVVAIGHVEPPSQLILNRPDSSRTRPRAQWPA
jgi:hypothetical protein